MSLDQFFSRYAQLSMGPQPEALAGLYAPTFIVGGPEGSRAFANDSHFLEWLGQVATFNRAHGMRNLAPVSIEGLELSPVHTLRGISGYSTPFRALPSTQFLSFLLHVGHYLGTGSASFFRVS